MVIAHLGERDGLTGLFNRRVFDRYLERVWQQAIDDKSLVVLMLVNADNFRSYNDRFGLRPAMTASAEVAAAMSACACGRSISAHAIRVSSSRSCSRTRTVLYAEDIPQHVRAAVAALGSRIQTRRMAGMSRSASAWR